MQDGLYADSGRAWVPPENVSTPTVVGEQVMKPRLVSCYCILGCIFGKQVVDLSPNHHETTPQSTPAGSKNPPNPRLKFPSNLAKIETSYSVEYLVGYWVVITWLGRIASR